MIRLIQPGFFSSKWPASLPLLLAGAGLAVLYVPTIYDLMNGLWRSEQQGHGPIVLLICIWLFWRARRQLAEAQGMPETGWAWPLLLLACLMYMLGRSQGILILEVASSIFMLTGCVLLLYGRGALKPLWFVLFFMLFLLPLPMAMVDAITLPMKTAVSWVAENLLFAVGYPIARTGVTLQIGSYQLLVADACAGLQTLFTLEAMGLLYLNVVRHASLLRNIGLAILIVPISFFANVIRVCVLILITYYFGDAAGQGFLHGFSGMVLFFAAFMMIIVADSLLRIGGKVRSLDA
ncbi:exosortase B [Craterilacuibacter sp.]|uniref:exosortase B n=1 Tax=Craterilacuibacter sp. TaxID=2870909 RepID=UPI003F37B8AE